MSVFSLFIFLALSSQSPSYENEIREKNKVSAQTREQDQKTFYQTISGKTQDVLKYIRMSKESLRKQQDVVRKDFESKIKSEIEEFKKKDPRATIEPLRKEANEKRRALFEKLNTEKKSLEDQLQEFKKSFEDFVKSQKEKFQQELKILSAKKEAAKLPPADSPIQQEFREIPNSPAIQLKPE